MPLSLQGEGFNLSGDHMDFGEDIDKATLQKTIDLLQASIDEDFRKEALNRDLASPYFRDVSTTMPGFTNGLDMKSIHVTVDPSLFKR
jgi:hypothetical protein